MRACVVQRDVQPAVLIPALHCRRTEERLLRSATSMSAAPPVHTCHQRFTVRDIQSVTGQPLRTLKPFKCNGPDMCLHLAAGSCLRPGWLTLTCGNISQYLLACRAIHFRGHLAAEMTASSMALNSGLWRTTIDCPQVLPYIQRLSCISLTPGGENDRFVQNSELRLVARGPQHDHALWAGGRRGSFDARAIRHQAL